MNEYVSNKCLRKKQSKKRRESLSLETQAPSEAVGRSAFTICSAGRGNRYRDKSRFVVVKLRLVGVKCVSVGFVSSRCQSLVLSGGFCLAKCTAIHETGAKFIIERKVDQYEDEARRRKACG